MYFKVEKGTETFKKIDEMMDKFVDYNKQAHKLVKELGYDAFGTSHRGVAGGISCINASEKPDGFKQVGKSYQCLYYPKANNKKIIEQIKDLPILSYDEYNETIGFKEQYQGLTHYSAFGLITGDDIYLIEIADDCKYEPLNDMVELLGSEYKKLVAKAGKE